MAIITKDDQVDIAMFKKGYRFKLVPLNGDYDALYAKNEEQVRDTRKDPPVKGLKFRVEFL